MRERLRNSRPQGLDGAEYQVDTTDNLATALKDKEGVAAMLHLIGMHDCASAFAERPWTLLDLNGKKLGPVKLVKDKSEQYMLMAIPPDAKNKALAVSLGTAHAVRVLNLPDWPFLMPSLVETRLWSGRLAIESNPDFFRTPLPWLTDKGFVRAVTTRNPLMLQHAIGLCMHLSLLLDVRQRFLTRMHREHPGYVPFAEAFRLRWMERAVREMVSRGQSCFAWGFLRKFGYVEMIEGGTVRDKNGKDMGRGPGFYRFNPAFQQKKFNVEKIAAASMAVYQEVRE